MRKGRVGERDLIKLLRLHTMWMCIWVFLFPYLFPLFTWMCHVCVCVREIVFEIFSVFMVMVIKNLACIKFICIRAFLVFCSSFFIIFGVLRNHHNGIKIPLFPIYMRALIIVKRGIKLQMNVSQTNNFAPQLSSPSHFIQNFIQYFIIFINETVEIIGNYIFVFIANSIEYLLIYPPIKYEIQHPVKSMSIFPTFSLNFVIEEMFIEKGGNE